MSTVQSISCKNARGVPQQKQKMMLWMWQWTRSSTSGRWQANQRHLANCSMCACPYSLCTKGSSVFGGGAMIGAKIHCQSGRGWIEFFGQTFFSIYSIFHDCNLLVYRWNSIMKCFVKEIHWEVSLFCDFVYISTYLCIFSLYFTCSHPQIHNYPGTITKYYVSMLLLYMYWASAIKICEKNPLDLSCLLDFCYFTTLFWHFLVCLSCFYPDVRCLTHTAHHYLSHWTCNHNWIASKNVIFCISCHYHSHLIIPYWGWGNDVTCYTLRCHAKCDKKD